MCAAAPSRKQWQDFPRGLHVILVVSDEHDRQEIAETLHSCEYNVTAFTNGQDALRALQTPQTSYDAALLETTANTDDQVSSDNIILEAARHLPVIVIATTEDIGTIMEAISYGAVDILQKPYSEEKLRNIWQHVARKAMEAEQSSEKAVKPEVLDECITDFESLHNPYGESFCEGVGNQSMKFEIEDSLDDINLGDGIVLDADGNSDFGIDASFFAGFHESDSDSVLNFDVPDAKEPEISDEEAMMLVQVLSEKEQEPGTCNISESESVSVTSRSPSPRRDDKGDEQTKSGKSSKKSASGKKKVKVDWTPELHQKFVQAVEKLGVDKAIPSRILELMGEEGLTRYNVASHLQKYRSHRKLREAEASANWNHRRHNDTSGSWSKTRAATLPRQTPILPAPPCGVPVLVWGHPAMDPHLWQQGPPGAWDGTFWQHRAPCVPPPPHWGPVHGAPVYRPMASLAPVTAPLVPERLEHSAGSHPPRDVVDAVIREALINPCKLPLGLKPPSMESVMTELGRKGIHITAPVAS